MKGVKAITKLEKLTEKTRKLMDYSTMSHIFDYVEARPEGAALYADSETSPACAALAEGYHLFLGGDISADFMRELYKTLFTAEHLARFGAAVIFYDGNRKTADAVRQVFSEVYENRRSLYLRKPAPIDAPEGETLVTPELLSSGLDNLTMLTNEVITTATYRDMADFCRRGIGIADCADGRVRGICVSEYQSAHCCGIGIGVEEKYRRQGIAGRMAKAFAAEAARRGLTAYWDCWIKNEASARTAVSCGFERAADSPVLFAELQK